MSLATQITALATAIGANIKALTGRVTTLENTGGTSGIPIQTTKTGSYTAALGDANTCTPFSAGNSILTIPPNASVAYAIGTILYAKSTGTGTAKFAQGSGVTVNDWANIAASKPNMWIRAVKVDTDTWDAQQVTPNFLVPGAMINGTLFTGSTGIDTPFTAVSSAIIGSGILTIATGLQLITVSLNQNVTSTVLTFTFPTGGFYGYGITLSIRFKQDATGGRTVALPSNFYPVSGSDTAVQSAANAYTLLVATTFDQGTRWAYVMKGVGS